MNAPEVLGLSLRGPPLLLSNDTDGKKWARSVGKSNRVKGGTAKLLGRRGLDELKGGPKSKV